MYIILDWQPLPPSFRVFLRKFLAPPLPLSYKVCREWHILSFPSVWIMPLHWFFLPLDHHHYVTFPPLSLFRFPSQITVNSKSSTPQNHFYPRFAFNLKLLPTLIAFTCSQRRSLPHELCCDHRFVFPFIVLRQYSFMPHSRVPLTNRPPPPLYIVVTVVISTEKS